MGTFIENWLVASKIVNVFKKIFLSFSLKKVLHNFLYYLCLFLLRKIMLSRGKFIHSNMKKYEISSIQSKHLVCVLNKITIDWFIQFRIRYSICWYKFLCIICMVLDGLCIYNVILLVRRTNYTLLYCQEAVWMRCSYQLENIYYLANLFSAYTFR